ncbi:metal ABC transporter solute-binding protein, Zn/Mn family [Roseovarius salis]|uniref:zinc ABC transporter substrate-binding protein n=1 Tax=Roseovarius salis TaxID=3376063 RepID=UPI0037CB58FF
MMFRSACVVLALLSAPARADVPVVATDIAAVHSLAAQVMEGVGTPEMVVQPGVSPHGHALRPTEAAALEAADLVFQVGGGLTPWLDGALETLSADASVLTLIEVPGTLRHAMRDNVIFKVDAHDAGHDHGHDGAHEDEEAAHDAGQDHGHAGGDHGHAHDGIDPHAWLDPENGKLWLDAMADALAVADPGNAALYRANAAEGKNRIEAATTRIETMLAPVRDARFVVFHDAYQYFERRFGLSVVGAIAVSDARTPGPARLARLRNGLAERNVVCIFAEPQFDPGIVEVVLEGSTARAAVLDPMGADIPPGPAFYTRLLTGLARAIVDCA